jgi:hypothetical protein
MKGYGEWLDDGKKNYLDEWFLTEWPNLYGSKDMTETFFNPKFHYYFMGLKIISYKADIMRRVKRNRATAYTDLIMLDYFNGLKIKPFQLEREYWQNNQKLYYKDEDLSYMIIKILKNIIRWHGIIISASRVYNYILWPNDFKMSNEQLINIDNEIKKWIKYSKSRILNDKENMNKINFIVKSYNNQ